MYIVLTISFLIGQEPPAYFENSCDFGHGILDKHDFSIICYPIMSADYTVYMAKEREHLNGIFRSTIIVYNYCVRRYIATLLSAACVVLPGGTLSCKLKV